MVAGVDLTNEGEDMMILGDVNVQPPTQKKPSALVPSLIAAVLAAGGAGTAAYYLAKQPTEPVPIERVDTDTQSIMEVDHD